jgi:hypothetical protein
MRASATTQVFPVWADHRRIGAVRNGAVDSRPVHSAACAQCSGSVYDQATFAEVCVWLIRHLDQAHGITGVSLEAAA